MDFIIEDTDIRLDSLFSELENLKSKQLAKSETYFSEVESNLVE